LFVWSLLLLLHFFLLPTQRTNSPTRSQDFRSLQIEHPGVSF
jgi:hypothetical protein